MLQQSMQGSEKRKPAEMQKQQGTGTQNAFQI